MEHQNPNNPKARTTRICVQRPFVIGEGKIASLGQCLTVEFFFANQLISALQARVATPEDEANWITTKSNAKKGAKEYEPDVVQTRAPLIQTDEDEDPPESSEPAPPAPRRGRKPNPK
jgi:hypothetical protein